MIQNGSEWDCELDALRRRPVRRSHWSWREGKATVATEMTRRRLEPFLFGSGRHKCVFGAFSARNLQNSPASLLINLAVSVALAVLGACWTMQYWKESAKFVCEGYFKGHFICTSFLYFESDVWYVLLCRIWKKIFKSPQDRLCFYCCWWISVWRVGVLGWCRALKCNPVFLLDLYSRCFCVDWCPYSLITAHVFSLSLQWHLWGYKSVYISLFCQIFQKLQTVKCISMVGGTWLKTKGFP